MVSLYFGDALRSATKLNLHTLLFCFMINRSAVKYVQWIVQISITHCVVAGTKGNSRQWTDEERDAVDWQLGKYVALMRVPRKSAIEQCIAAESVLGG
jgi:hypothetical protein